MEPMTDKELLARHHAARHAQSRLNDMLTRAMVSAAAKGPFCIMYLTGVEKRPSCDCPGCGPVRKTPARKPSKRDIEYAEAQARRLYHLGRLPPAVAREVAAGIAQDNAKGQPMTEYECPRGCRGALPEGVTPDGIQPWRCLAHGLRMHPVETAQVHNAISRINSGDDKRLGSAQYTRG